MKEAVFRQSREKEKLVRMGLFAIIAGLFVLFFSTSTTPLLNGPVTGDSAIFQTIGKYWARGIRPYTGLWDHKGPVIYFLNALGYKLLDSYIGVFVIQIIFLAITEVFIDRLFLMKFTGKQSFFLTIIVLFSLMFNYSEGNGTEEYLLPLLMLSFIGFFRWCEDCRQGTDEHRPKDAFVYGITASFCFLTRLTNAVGLCFGVFFITIWLAVKKKWKNLFANAAAFLGGFFLLSLPFIIYFGMKGELGEMWYGTITYNLEYAESSGFRLMDCSWKELAEILIGYINTIGLVMVGILVCLIDENRRNIGILWMLIGGGTALWLFQSNGYLHYAVITLPYLAIELNELKGFSEKYCGSKLVWGATVAIMRCLILVSILGGGIRVKNLGDVYEYYLYGEEELQLLGLIPEKDKDSFVAYDGDTNLYLIMDVCPCYRYFIYQNWQSRHSETLLDRIYEIFENGDAKWILVADAGNAKIQAILDKRYECIAKEEKGYYVYKLYRMSDKAWE